MFVLDFDDDAADDKKLPDGMRMKKTKYLKMMAKLLQISPIEQKEPPKVNKNSLSLVPTKKGTPFWALYDGNSIVS